MSVVVPTPSSTATESKARKTRTWPHRILRIIKSCFEWASRNSISVVASDGKQLFCRTQERICAAKWRGRRALQAYAARAAATIAVRLFPFLASLSARQTDCCSFVASYLSRNGRRPPRESGGDLRRRRGRRATKHGCGHTDPGHRAISNSFQPRSVEPPVARHLGPKLLHDPRFPGECDVALMSSNAAPSA